MTTPGPEPKYLSKKAMRLRNQFKREIEFRGLAKDTQQTYLRWASAYLESCNGELTRDSVMAYSETLSGRSGTTRRWVMTILKVFFEAVNVKWPIRKNEMPKRSAPSRPFVKQAEAEALIESIKGDPLDYAMFRLAIILGCRRVELVRMQLADYKRPNINVRTAKGGEPRVRQLDPETCRVLDAWLAVRDSLTEALFVTPRGFPVSTKGVSERFTKHARALGFAPRKGVHAVRRGVVTWLFKAGMREKEIQELIGWRSATMPAVYIQLETGDTDRKAQAVHPFMQPATKRKPRNGATKAAG